ncbi:MAG: polysaccharide pyruvyl transferase family protein [Clostridium sp.]
MKNIGIITLYDYNLGNRLQNYALQTYLQSMDVSVKTLRYTENKTLKIFIKDNLKFLLAIIGVKKYRLYYFNKVRKEKFKKFNKLYIVKGEKILANKQLKINSDNYDYFVVGSDQVWHNWNKGYNELDYFYLRFAEEKKRISYAPSFGFSKFPKEDIKKHIEGLNGMRALSCREEDGCALIKSTIKKDAVRLIDPSFLLTSQQWRVIENKPKWFNEKEKYILTYFLGNKPQEYLDYIDKLVKSNNIRVINILSKDSKNEYVVSPDEFVYLIDNAEYICTDSFHACAFSLIFSKKFIAFPRKEEGMEDMKGRIDTLFNILNIKNKWYTEVDINKYEQESDYFKLIDKERKKANNYLKKNLR